MAKNDLKLFAGGSSANVMSQAEYEALASLINGFSTGVAQSKQLNKVWRQASFVAAMIGLFTGKKSEEDVLDDGDVDSFEEKFSRAMQAFIAGQTAIGSYWLPVISLTITTPPSNPTLGDAYVIPSAATGVWAGKANFIAVWSGAKWKIFAAKDGHGVSLPNGRVFERIGGQYIEKLALDTQSGKWTYAVAEGSADAITTTLAPAPLAYVEGIAIRLKIATTNTGEATLNVNGFGAKAIVRPNGSVLQPGDLAAGGMVEVVYDGSRFVLIGQPQLFGTVSYFTSAGAGTVTVPQGCTVAEVELWGGGGGGGWGSANRSGDGGGGGAYAYKRLVSLTPGQVLNYVIGAAGDRGFSTVQNGTAGGTTSFNGVFSAGGGLGGRGGTGSSFATNGGSPTNADIGLVGGTGGPGMNLSSFYGAGVGGSAPKGGLGGAGGSGGGPVNGSGPGGGGSGGSNSNAGGFGAPGSIFIRWS